MKIGRLAIVCFVALSSSAPTGVAPSKSELAAMYDQASRELEAGHYDEALKELDAIDARQPDLPETQNLRGVTLMRQGQYEKAEAVLRRAREIEPKFLDSRFNLAEVAFLKKNWAEARNQFEALLASNSRELEEKMAQLIQYKILLTLVLENKASRFSEILSRFEGWGESPAFDYARAAIAWHDQKKEEAEEWMAAAEKQFSPQLNKLFLESFYEVGWMQKPIGEARPALEFTSATERAARTKADAEANFDKAKHAFQQRDFDSALKFLDRCDKDAANQAASLNLRGEILMAQKKFDEAEAALQKALVVDPALWDAKYNLALLPFKWKDYAAARNRLEALLGDTPAEEKNRGARLVQYQIFLALLLEGKESAAQKIMDQFKFTDDTPAFYYAQAAWGFQHNNQERAHEWVGSASKLFSPALNSAFADSLADLGWFGSLAAEPAITPTPVTLAEAAPVTTRVLPASETSSAPSASPKKESLGRASQTSLGEAKKKHRPRHRKNIAAKSKPSPVTRAKTQRVAAVDSAASPGATALPAASPSASPRPPFLKRLARTLLHPFNRGTHKNNSNDSDQPGSSKPVSSVPTPAERSHPQN